jgi:hypothetical protein
MPQPVIFGPAKIQVLRLYPLHRISHLKNHTMKTFILTAIVFSCTAIFASVAPVPVSPANGTHVAKSVETAFSFIRGHKQGTSYNIQWGMNNNFGVSSFIIESTYEDPYDPYSVWATIGTMPCTNSPIFKFSDSPQLPGSLSYRVTAVLNDSRTVVSAIHTIVVPF